MAMSEVCAYEFGRCRIDLVAGEITRDGRQLSLRPRLFDLLLLLVKNQGALVTREEIIDQIWADTIVEDANITQSIHFLRRVIDEPDQNESRILTIPKRGYIFTAAVRSIGPEPFPEVATIDNPEAELVPVAGREGRLRDIWQRRGVRVGLVISIIAVALLTGSYFIFKSSIRSLTILSRYAIPSHQLDPEFSPDGRFLAFSSLGETDSNEDIYLKTVDQAQRIRLTTHPEAERTPVWSPDGERIAFLRWSKDDRLTARVIIADHKGGAEVEVGRSRGALGWMPDGRHLVVNDLEVGRGEATVLFLLSLDGQERRQLTTATSPGTVDTMPRAARFSRTIAFLRKFGETGDIHLLDVPTGRISQVTQEEGAISFFQWGGREGGFYLVSNRSGVPRLWFFGLPGLVSRIYGQTGSARLVEQMPYQLHQFTILVDPPLLAYAQQIKDEQVRIFELSGQEAFDSSKSCLLPEARSDQPPQFAPAGDQVAYPGIEGDQERIWVAQTDCRERVRLPNLGGGRIRHLRWSPDGSRLVFEQWIDGQSEIWTIGSDGATPRRLTQNSFDDLEPSWSADGRSIYHVVREGGREAIHRLPADGGESVVIIPDGGREPVASADGKNLYFVRNGFIFVAPLITANGTPGGGEGRPFKDLRVDGHWQLSPTAVSSVVDTTGESMVLDHLDLMSGKSARLTRIEGIRPSAVNGIALSPHRRFLAMVLKLGSIGELTTVEGWRLKPFTEHMIDIFHHEELFFPERWLKRISQRG